MLQSYACRIVGDNHETIVHHRTPGKAKREYHSLISDCCPDLQFTDIRVRRLGGPVTPDGFRRTADYRGVPFARVGMQVSVGGQSGVIVGNNCSGNFDVLFDSRYGGEILNCHPNHEIVYFDDDGTEIQPDAQ